MSQPRVKQLKVKYTNNCTLLGELQTQRHALEKRIEALAAENVMLTAEFEAIRKVMAEAEEEAKKSEKSDAAGKSTVQG